MDYSKLDLDDGFVLSQKQAIEFLRWGVEQEFEQAIGELGIDCTTAGAFMEDVVAMAQVILDKDWGWVKFEASPMSASGITIKEMKEE
jgi:hypothetical protein